MKTLLIQGANMEYLGFRKSELYGTTTAAEPVQLPYIEVHITNIDRRGMSSVLAGEAIRVITGFGVFSYRLALQTVSEHLLKGH